MKRLSLILTLAVSVGCFALFAFTPKDRVTPHNPVATEFTINNQAYLEPAAGGTAPFQTRTLTDTASNKFLAINCWFIDRSNFYVEAGDSILLALSKVKNGGDYRLLVKKTTASVITITRSGIVVGTSPISLSGSANSYFWIDFTALPNGSVAMHKR